MIKKILKIRNVGLLRDAISKTGIGLTPFTMIYAENGIGKSTLAMIIRSIGNKESTNIISKKTIDSEHEPYIEILTQDGKTIHTHKFENSQWSNQNKTPVEVFDSEFVEKNIYSGSIISAEHRQSLLEFALGDQTVEHKHKVDELTRQYDEESKNLTTLARAIKGLSQQLSLELFIALPEVPKDYEDKVKELESSITALRNINQINGRPKLSIIDKVNIDLTSIENLLSKQLKDVESSAEEIVTKHFKNHDRKIEEWVNEGQILLKDSTCPFCGSNTENLEIISAYKTYFNQNYNALKKSIKDTQDDVNKVLSEGSLNSVTSSISMNDERIKSWESELGFELIPFDSAKFKVIFRELRSLIQIQLLSKGNKPLEAIDLESSDCKVSEKWNEINKLITEYNDSISTYNEAIDAYKSKLKPNDISKFQIDLSRLRLTKVKNSKDVLTLISQYSISKQKVDALVQLKKELRAEIDKEMESTLSIYQSEINNTLKSLNANFSIEKLKHTYQGTGEPRSEYILKLRNYEVSLVTRDPKYPSFSSTLSEADKRTLALAFFAARLKQDKKLSSKIIVFDDPMSSLDRNRRDKTLRLICELSATAIQTILLSHDAYFLRDVKNHAERIKLHTGMIHLYEIRRGLQDYSVLENCDLEGLCASPYYRHHANVSKFVQGDRSVRIESVAQSIRPLLEGYYHRRFPGLISKQMMFGNIIKIISESTPPSPLVHLHANIESLSEVNDYVTQFHHNDGESNETIVYNETEILGYAKTAIELIEKHG